MRKRVLNVDWRSINGACQKKRILHLKCDPAGIFYCPINSCLHMGHKSQRGLRKHIDSTHTWYYYFNEQPTVNRGAALEKVKERVKCVTSKKPAFSLEKGMGMQFLTWLATPCGGGKCSKEALQIGRRAMKFLMASMGEQEEETVSEGYADCCLGSPSIIISFFKLITEEWEISSSGALNYMKAIGDLMDFRKSSGVSDEVLRSFAVSEVYIRRGKDNLSKQKRMQYARNLQLEKLIAHNSWASVDEMEKVIPYHTTTYKSILALCQESDANPTISQLAFATRFIVTFLFLRVKCTRPMSYQYLTVQMFEDAKENGGFIDQTAFKTHETYVFDTLVLTEPVLHILDTYKRHIRPLCNPSSDFFIITTNGTQYKAFCSAMSLLVHEAIGKYVNPTRYRQIVETESNERLNEKERETISKDQKHSSYVAKRVYQKKLSREVAVSGRECMQKIVGNERDNHTSALASSLSGVSSISESKPHREKTFRPTVAYKSKDNDEFPPSSTLCRDSGSKASVELGEEKEFSGDDTPTKETVLEKRHDDNSRPDRQSKSLLDTHISNDCLLSPISPLNMDVEVKREEAEKQVRDGTSIKRFSPAEDKYLKMGVKRYGSSSWSRILQDEEYKFCDARTRDSLRMRAKTLKLARKDRK